VVRRAERTPLRRIETRTGAPTVSPPPWLPLVRFAALRSFYAPGPWGYWFPTPATSSPFPTGKAVSLRSPSPARLRKRVHPPMSSTPLQSAAVPSPPRASRRRAPSLGSAFPLRDISQQRPDSGVPLPPTCRPRRFSRPRRFPPPLALWVYFTPQPRPGFALQGFSLSHSRTTSSVARALPSVGDSSLLAVAHQRHVLPPRPQGFAPCESPLPALRCLAAAPARSPPGLSLLQVLPLGAARMPSHSPPLVTLVRKPSQSFPSLAFSVSSSSPACLSRGCRPVQGSLPAVATELPLQRRRGPLSPCGPLRPPTVYGLNHFARAVPTLPTAGNIRVHVFPKG
jgi:hypothetical protein